MPGRLFLGSIGFATAVAAFGAPGLASAAQVFEDLTVDRVYFQYFKVPPFAERTWETTELGVAVDTVAHVWSFTEGEVAYNDNCGEGLGSCVTYINDSADTRVVVLIVRVRPGSAHGTAKLLQDGQTYVEEIPVGGVTVEIENGEDWTHEAVPIPGGPTSPFLMALDENDHLVDVDFVGGVGKQPRLGHPDAVAITVGLTSGLPGKVNLYSNDLDADYDQDGLGSGLEAELGLCDTPFLVCSGVHNLHDTDRDGLPDAAEVFGIEDTFDPQYLPRWGADPRHKDVFLEVDYTDEFSGHPVSEVSAGLAAERFAAGYPEELLNPDFEGGVRLHLDIGQTCMNPGLCGDWGGSDELPATTNYVEASSLYRSSARMGVFRYALANYNSGGGQALGDRFVWGPSDTNFFLGTFVHELGHTLGLPHWGHRNWGPLNGKPHYVSVMNYGSNVDTFSHGDNELVLNPAFVDEGAGVGFDPSYLSDYPYFRSTGPDGEVDWDFDGLFSEGGYLSTRAPLTWATVGTDALSVNEQALYSTPEMPGTTPSMALGDNGFLYSFFVDNDRLRFRFGQMDGETAAGSCPLSDEIGESCTNWGATFFVPTPVDVRGASVLAHDGRILVAYRSTQDRLHTIVGTLDGSGDISWEEDVQHGVKTDREPEVDFVRVDPGQFGDEVVIGIFYRSPSTGQYRWRSMDDMTDTSSQAQGILLDEESNALAGTQSPTMVNWPYDPRDAEDGRTCAAITDLAGAVHFRCYEPDDDAWVELPAFGETYPTTDAKPGLAYRAYRLWTGTTYLDDYSRGAFWLAVTKAKEEHDHVVLSISDPVSQDGSESLADLVFPPERSGWFGNPWINLQDGSGLALYDTPTLGAMKGLWIREDGSDNDEEPGYAHVRFLPFADGTFRAELRDGSDFEVMERGICVGLAGSEYCGPSAFGLD